jgi:hypothetical protein
MAQNGGDTGVVMNLAKEMILDEKGNLVMEGENTLPSDIAMRALTKVIETLGK